jgi:transposase InsO family protein
MLSGSTEESRVIRLVRSIRVRCDRRWRASCDPSDRTTCGVNDFVSGVTHYGRTLKMLTLIDEYTRESLAIRVDRRLRSQDLIQTLADTMLMHGCLNIFVSDNRPEFVARALRSWLLGLGPNRSTSSRTAMGERLLRIVQRQAVRRAAQR